MTDDDRQLLRDLRKMTDACDVFCMGINDGRGCLGKTSPRRLSASPRSRLSSPLPREVMGSRDIPPCRRGRLFRMRVIQVVAVLVGGEPGRCAVHPRTSSWTNHDERCVVMIVWLSMRPASKVEDLADSPEFRERATHIMRRHTESIRDSLEELASFNLIKETSVQVRVHRSAPMFKLYIIINNEEIFYGFYPVREHIIQFTTGPQAIYDLMGKDAVLFHHAATDDPESTGTQYLHQARMWFDSVWTSVAREFTI